MCWDIFFSEGWRPWWTCAFTIFCAWPFTWISTLQIRFLLLQRFCLRILQIHDLFLSQMPGISASGFQNFWNLYQPGVCRWQSKWVVCGWWQAHSIFRTILRSLRFSLLCWYLTMFLAGCLCLQDSSVYGNCCFEPVNFWISWLS